ncbi:MAG: lysophospholipid acyltransferase family protein [Prevotella sp.]|nr:lysophospholipid acyltransferase family protein [Prevotella sp.]
MNILYYIIYGVVYTLSLLPLRVHYFISDLLYYVCYYVVRYRRKVVRRNLTTSFPEKSEKELLRLEKDFYHFFCDYVAESTKLLTMRRENLMRRMHFTGTEEVNKILREGQSVVMYLGHYCTWEWVTSLQLWMEAPTQVCQVYHPLENKAFDRFFVTLRERQGSHSIAMNDTLREVMGFHRDKRPILVGYLSDQVPTWNNIHHWVDFLNHDTPVITGTERLARKMNDAVIFLDMRRERRGYYVGDLKVITREPKKMQEYEITDTYFRLFEACIRRDPARWLWSHNRWKRTREEFNARFYEENGKVFSRTENAQP